MSVNRGTVTKMWYVLHTIEYYPTFIQKEILPYVITWMKLEDILLSEIRPSHKDKYYKIPLNLGI